MHIYAYTRKTWLTAMPFNPWTGKIPWRRAWKPTSYSCLENPHGQRSLMGSSWLKRIRYNWITKHSTQTFKAHVKWSLSNSFKIKFDLLSSFWETCFYIGVFIQFPPKLHNVAILWLMKQTLRKIYNLSKLSGLTSPADTIWTLSLWLQSSVFFP